MFELVVVICAIGVFMNFALGIFSAVECAGLLLLLIASDVIHAENCK